LIYEVVREFSGEQAARTTDIEGDCMRTLKITSGTVVAALVARQEVTHV
jgi:hypothetical protein